MGDTEQSDAAPSSPPGLSVLIPDKTFLTSRKGLLLVAELVLSFIIFICYLASSMAAFMAAPLIEFLLALSAYYVYVTKYIDHFPGFHGPLIDFLRCVTAAVIFFAISIYAITKSAASSKTAGVFGFVATVVFAFDFYYISSHLISLINPQDLPTHTATIKKSTGEEEVADSDSD
ncbi:CKLF-like MARVEL transmembrane domain-containing protein 3 [Carcharodon carcharias]|uniref:CKLF-like MARVEL transmembrane domain-containing protein 3 n=1 Tax=Carcharodon carcharias TaxID=13397 RepID=UPI001B7F310A|nr:CKLF-like MARVEL transmembrane domain-containing protein 3 [Carcharodon carcharias]